MLLYNYSHVINTYYILKVFTAKIKVADKVSISIFFISGVSNICIYGIFELYSVLRCGCGRKKHSDRRGRRRSNGTAGAVWNWNTHTEQSCTDAFGEVQFYRYGMKPSTAKVCVPCYYYDHQRR